mmetsp:Transcript_23663/g.65814  ORF Transcript_23663/g.65814 Transcript_23663/m.65814 type:complete len:281 (+) Transcript_23663:114-956(+)
MEERERCLMEQPIPVLQAHAQECGINVTGCLEKRELVRQIMRSEPEISIWGQSMRIPEAQTQSEDDLLADENFARRLQAEERHPLLAQSVGNEGLAQALESILQARATAAAAAANAELGREIGIGGGGGSAAPVRNGQEAPPEEAGAGGELQPGQSQPQDADSAAQALVALIGQALSRGDDRIGVHSVLTELLGGLMQQRGIDTAEVNARTVTTTLRGEETPQSSLSAEHRQCMVCLENFQGGDEVRILPCLHRYHSGCVDPWLTSRGSCPLCKTQVSRR